MAQLNVFAARAQFTGKDGRLTPEASRVMRDVLRRSNGLPGEITGITVGASPFTYTASEDGTLSISGGTVTPFTQITRGAATITLGVVDGLVPMKTGDAVTVTYSQAPTMAFIPG